MQAELRDRISKAQDEEGKWSILKKFLRGEFDKLTHEQVSCAGKIVNQFMLSDDGVLYYLGRRRKSRELPDGYMKLRLVVPTNLIDETLLNCHDTMGGGHQGIVRTFHRVKSDFYWTGLYADVKKHIQACEDCSTSKNKPHLRGYSPGNVVSDRPFHMVSMDFVIPLPATRHGNTGLLLYQDHFTGFVIDKV